MVLSFAVEKKPMNKPLTKRYRAIDRKKERARETNEGRQTAQIPF